MNTPTYRYAVLILGLLVAGGCEGTKETLGMGRNSPDEFAVVKRAPLEMPPDYALRPPRPGSDRPQEQAPEQTARESLFGAKPVSGHSRAGLSQGESALLDATGAGQAKENIREIVNKETAGQAKKEQPVIDRLIGREDKEAPAQVVDAPEEYKRIRTGGEGKTPSKEQ